MIKNSQKQTGSAHVIIIVILVLALLGTLGFIFWQNLSKSNTKVSVPATKSVTEISTQMSYVQFSDWGVKLPVNTEALGTSVVAHESRSSAVVDGEDFNYYSLNTTRIQALGGVCAEDGNGVVLSRATEIQSDGTLVAQIGKWYYYAQSQGNCSTSNVAVQESDTTAILNLVKNLQTD